MELLARNVAPLLKQYIVLVCVVSRSQTLFFTQGRYRFRYKCLYCKR